MNANDAKAINNMMKHGGAFVKHLAITCQYADCDNLQIIKNAFPNIFNRYMNMESQWPSKLPLSTEHP